MRPNVSTDFVIRLAFVHLLTRDGLGKEIISRFTTDLATNGVWYTDANGRGSNDNNNEQ